MRKIILLVLFIFFINLVSAASVTVCPLSCNYSSIQNAVYNASNGDIINVLNGSYNENVTVNQSVTLNASSYISLTGGINISADNVTIRGFNITQGISWDPDGSGINGAYAAGILITNNNTIIQNNYISIINSTKGNDGIVDGDTAGDGGIAAGIYLSGSANNNISNNTIIRIYSEMGGSVQAVDVETTGGNGGIATGIYLINSINNNVSLNNISNIFGGQGGTTVSPSSGGTGGLATGIYLSNSNNNNFSSNNITGIVSGNGGSGGTADGAAQIGFGIYINPDSYNNEIDTTNSLDGEAIYYYYKKNGITLNNLILNKNVSPINLGKVVLINSSNFTITNNTIANFTGESGNAGAHSVAGENGAIGTAIYLLNSSSVNISSNTITQIYGGEGGSGGRYGSGGNGGVGSGIYLADSSNNNISNNNISNIISGVGGVPGYDSTGGNGGIGNGIYLTGSSYNLVLNNTILQINGSQGGVGNYRGSGGTGGTGTGIYLTDSTINNISLNTITEINSGSGGLPGMQTPSSSGANQSNFGIYINSDSYNNEIDSTNTVDGEKVFYFYNETSIIIRDNVLTKNNGPTNLGKIVLINSSDFLITNNTIANFTGEAGRSGDWPNQGDSGIIASGIYLSNSSNNNLTNNNIMQIYGGKGGTGGYNNYGGAGGNSHGIYLDLSLNNLLYNNTITQIDGGRAGPGTFEGDGGTGGMGIGIYLRNSSNNNLTYNNITNINFGLAGDAGILGNEGTDGQAAALYLTSGSNNTIYYNWIYNNSNYSIYNNQNLNITTELNYFGVSTSAEMNSLIYDYYDDNSLGIVDYNPYYLDTSFTITSDQAPIITINSPVNNYNSSNSTITFNITIESNQTITNISLYANFSGTFVINETNSTDAGSYLFTKEINDGSYIWAIEACDDDNCTISSNRTIFIDSVSPSVTVLSPANNSLLSTSKVVVRASYSDNNLVNCKVQNDSGLWYDMDNDNLISGTANYTFTNLSDGSHNITINCSDSLLSTIKTINISIDTTIIDNDKPSISVTLPVNNSYPASSTVALNADFNDSTNVNCYAKLDSNSWQDMDNDATTSGIANYTFSNVGEGNHNIAVNCTDSSDNNATANVSFTVDTIYPVINLISPANSSSWTSSSTVTFSYNVTDEDINSCSLIINNIITENDTSITVNTTQTISKSLSNADYNWSINCSDMAGNENNSETRSLTVSYSASTPPSISSGGGGGSGGGGSAPSSLYEKTVSWQTMPKGIRTMNIRSSFIPFTRLEIDVKKEVTEEASVTVKLLTEKPAVELIDTKVYNYLQIEKTKITDNDINEVKIKFRVNKSWFKDIKKEDIALYRHTNEWIELPTEINSSDDNYVYYEAISKGFSYFAIAEKVKEVGEEIIEEGWKIINTTKEEEIEDIEESTSEDKNLRLPWIIGSIIAIIILIAVIPKKRGIKKQIKAISKHIKAGNIQEAKQDYNKLKEKYNSISAREKKKYYPEIKQLLDKVNGR